MRTIIDIPQHQLDALAQLCAREKISRAEAVRRALDTLLSGQKATTRQAAFGAWAASGNSRTEVEAMLAEWSR